MMGWLQSTVEPPEKIHFLDLKLPQGGYYLLAPEGFTDVVTRPFSPVFSCDVSALEAAWHAVISKEARVRSRSFSASQHRYHYVRRTAIFRLPAYVIVQFIPVSSTQSTLALYSYFLYDLPDFGNNQEWVFRLLIKVKKYLGV